MDYSNVYLLNQKVFTESVSRIPGKDIELVMMYKTYLLDRVNVSTRYLLYGYSKYFENAGPAFSDEFLDYQKTAMHEKRGIWIADSLTVNDTLDSDYIKNPEKNYAKYDSVLEYKTTQPAPIYFAIPLELLAGSGITILSSFGSALLGAAFTSGKSFGGLIFAFYGTIAGYLIGFPSGVYLVAKGNNPDLDYFATIGFTWAFTAAVSGISYGLFPKDNKHFTRYIALASPIIGALLYSNFIAPNPSSNTNENKLDLSNENISHKDFYNSKMYFNIEVFKINF